MKSGQQKPPHNRGGFCCIFGFFFLNFFVCLPLFLLISCCFMRLQAFFSYPFLYLGFGCIFWGVFSGLEVLHGDCMILNLSLHWRVYTIDRTPQRKQAKETLSETAFRGSPKMLSKGHPREVSLFGGQEAAQYPPHPKGCSRKMPPSFHSF